jgi:hypothetical protein
MGMTTADMLRAEGYAQARVGYSGGLLVRLLTRKFGTMSHEALDRICAASPEQLEAWLVRLLDATTLDEVFD